MFFQKHAKCLGNGDLPVCRLCMSINGWMVFLEHLAPLAMERDAVKADGTAFIFVKLLGVV